MFSFNLFVYQARRLLDHVGSKGEAAAAVVLQFVQQRKDLQAQQSQKNLTPTKGLLSSEFKSREVSHDGMVLYNKGSGKLLQHEIPCSCQGLSQDKYACIVDFITTGVFVLAAFYCWSCWGFGRHWINELMIYKRGNKENKLLLHFIVQIFCEMLHRFTFTIMKPREMLKVRNSFFVQLLKTQQKYKLWPYLYFL